MDSSSLILLLAVPAAGAIIGAFLHDSAARSWALLVSLITFVISIWVAAQLFSGNAPVFNPPGEHQSQLFGIGTGISLGVTPISIWLVLLTTFLQPLAILSSFGSITLRQGEYYAWMNALLVAMLGVFIARDLLLFYVFFELTLVPMFFIIGIWGGPDRRNAAGKFFLFTFTGGVLTLAAAVYVGVSAHTFSLDDWTTNGVLHYGAIHFAQSSMSDASRWWVMLGLLAGFAVKTPLFPVHTWLPLAHTEAPTAGSVILAGVLLKLGTYGLLAVAVPIGLIGANGPIFPGLVHFVSIMCVIGILYGALCAWVQPDIKKLVAFSSVSHLGFCVLGLFALNDIGMQGSVLYMINHGLSTGAMFLVIGMIYDRYHTRDINKLSGLARNMPVLAFFFIFFTLSSIGLPGLNGFVSEFLTTLGAFTSPYLNPWFGSVAAIGIILGAVYMLHMAARVIMGPLKVPDVDHGAGHGQADQGQSATPDHAGHGSHAGADHGGVKKNDIGPREIAILIPLAIVVVILGVRPGIVISGMRAPLEDLRHVPVALENKPAATPAPMAQGHTDPVVASATVTAGH